MKKLFMLMLVMILTIHIFATDIRQVMFGNNYETIHEVDSSHIFNEYPDVKTYMDTLNISEFKWKDSELNNGISKRFYRTFEQTIGNQKYIRVVKGACELTDDFILNWRNPYKSAIEGHSYITQLFYVAENCIYGIGKFTVMEANGYTWENGTNLKYEMVEIIQRNGNVKGFLFNYLEDIIDHHNRAEENGIYEEVYANTAEYYRFEDIIENASEKCGNVKYLGDYSKISVTKIRTDQPLIDAKRPFMYTVNNIFDGNCATSYVENTKDNLLFITVYNKKFENISMIKLVNGYSSNYELYKNNSRIKSLGDYYINSESLDNEKTFYSNASVEVRDLYRVPQILKWNDSILAVNEIYKGEKYSDTCISELDFYDEIYGWIFEGKK